MAYLCMCVYVYIYIYIYIYTYIYIWEREYKFVIIVLNFIHCIIVIHFDGEKKACKVHTIVGLLRHYSSKLLLLHWLIFHVSLLEFFLTGYSMSVFKGDDSR